MGQRKWTNSEEATFLRLRSEGKNLMEISIELGRSYESVCGKMLRIRMKEGTNRKKIKELPHADKKTRKLSEFITEAPENELKSFLLSKLNNKLIEK